eukprot:122545_1
MNVEGNCKLFNCDLNAHLSICRESIKAQLKMQKSKGIQFSMIKQLIGRDCPNILDDIQILYFELVLDKNREEKKDEDNAIQQTKTTITITSQIDIQTAFNKILTNIGLMNLLHGNHDTLSFDLIPQYCFVQSPSISNAIVNVFLSTSKTDELNKTIQLEELKALNVKNTDFLIGFKAQFCLRPFIKDPVTISALFHKYCNATNTQNTFRIIFALKNIVLHKRIVIKTCKATIKQNNIVSISGQCHLFSVDLDCKVDIDKETFSASICSEEINIGNILNEIWNSAPEILNKYPINNFELICDGNRKIEENDQDLSSNMRIKACIQIQKLWKELTKWLQLDSVLESLNIQFEVKKLFLRPGSNSSFPIKFDLRECDEKHIDENIDMKIKKYIGDEFVFGFQSALEMKSLFKCKTEVIMLISKDNDKSKPKWKLKMFISKIEINSKISLENCEISISSQGMTITGKVDIFAVVLDAKVDVTKQEIELSMTAETISFGSVLTKTWDACPSFISCPLQKIEMKNFHLWMTKSRDNSITVKEIFFVNAAIDFTKLFTVFCNAIGLTDFAKIKTHIGISLDIDRFMFRPSNYSKFPINIDIGAKTDSDTLQIDDFEEKKVDKDDSMMIAFGAKLKIIPIIPKSISVSLLIIANSKQNYIIKCAVGNVKLHENIKIVSCCAMFTNEKMQIDGKCKLFGYDLKAELIISKRHIHAAIKSNRISQKGGKCDSITEIFGNNCPDILNEVLINYFELKYEQDRQSATKKSDIVINAEINTKSAIENVMTKLGLNNISKGIDFKLFPKYFFIRSGSESNSRICMFLVDNIVKHEESLIKAEKGVEKNKNTGYLSNIFGKMSIPQWFGKGAYVHDDNEVSIPDNDKFDPSLGFGAVFILKPFVKEEVTIDAVIKRTNDGYVVAFALQNIVLHEK